MKSQTVKIESIATIKGGKRLPKGHELITAPTKHPYIRARDIGNGKIEIQEPVYIADSTFQKIKQYTVKNNDILVTIVGVNIGDVGIVTESLDGANLTENAAKISTNKNVCNPNFLLCHLATPRNKFKFQQIAAGAAQGKLGLFKIKDFKVLLPPIDVQKKISDIYFAYTNLIDINRKRIQLLEEAARLLFREWFVYFRFPGHDPVRKSSSNGVKIVDDVPEGWEKLQVKDIIRTVNSRKKLQKSEYEQVGLYPCIDQSQEFIGGHTDRKDYVINSNLPIVIFGDHTRTIKYVDFPFVRGADGTQLLVSKNSKISPGFLYFILKNINLSNYFYARHFKFLKDQWIIVPSENLCLTFSMFSKDIMKQIGILRDQNQKLAQARDLLLPRLMNGTIQV